MGCAGVLCDTGTGPNGGAQDGGFQWLGPSSPSVLLWWDPGVLGLQVTCPSASPQSLSWGPVAPVGSMSCSPTSLPRSSRGGVSPGVLLTAALLLLPRGPGLLTLVQPLPVGPGLEKLFGTRKLHQGLCNPMSWGCPRQQR